MQVSMFQSADVLQSVVAATWARARASMATDSTEPSSLLSTSSALDTTTLYEMAQSVLLFVGNWLLSSKDDVDAELSDSSNNRRHHSQNEAAAQLVALALISLVLFFFCIGSATVLVVVVQLSRRALLPFLRNRQPSGPHEERRGEEQDGVKGEEEATEQTEGDEEARKRCHWEDH